MLDSGAPDPVDPNGRRGHVTVLFADLCGYTALSEAADPEDIDRLRRQIEQLAAAVMKKHGGAITQCYGDGILAVFGFPAPTEDDSRSAVNAAIDLHQSVRAIRWSHPTGASFDVRL